MLFNYLKLSFRLMGRSPFFTVINLIGLSVGFAVFFVLWQYSQSELKSDQFHKDHERIFRLYADWYYDPGAGWIHYQSGSFTPFFATYAKEKFSDIETTTRIFNQNNFDEIWFVSHSDSSKFERHDATVVFSYFGKDSEKHSFLETKTAYADPNLFEFFSVPLLKGQPHQVLANPNAIVLSLSATKKYFGNEDAIGKTLILNDGAAFIVSGIFQDLPKNSHLNFEVVMSSLRLKNTMEDVKVFSRSAQIYLKLRKGAIPAPLEAQLNKEQKILWPWDEWWGAGNRLTLFLQPLKEVPFSVFDNDAFAPKSKQLLTTFGIVAIIILAMAWINYLNLKLFSQSKRLKELVVRKTAGAQKADFAWQFLTESVVMNGLAILIAIVTVQSIKEPLATTLQFYIPDWNQIKLSELLALAGTILAGVLIVGLQPAILIWRLTVLKILAQWKFPKRKMNFSIVSTTVQYIGAIGMAIWLFAMANQVEFVMRDNWGIDRDRVVVVDLPIAKSVNFSSQVGTLKNKIALGSGVDDVTTSVSLPGDAAENRLHFDLIDSRSPGRTPKTDGGVDERFIPFFGIRLLAGRNFMADNPADQSAVILSREAAKSVGLEPEEAIGKLVTIEKRKQKVTTKIIGVIEDYAHKPLYLETSFSKGNLGLILTYGSYLRPAFEPGKMVIKMHGLEFDENISTIEKQFKEIFPGQLFHWYVLNDEMNAHYKNEVMARNQIILFTIIALGIACLGLLGMVSNKVVEKTKEIGIRKVLGADLRQIAQILLHTPLRQVLVASAISIPIAYLLTQQYLHNFSKHIELQWWHYVLPIVVLILIMLSTIATVVWKAVRSNPVKALKYE